MPEDVLSQNEIDALFTDIAQTGADGAAPTHERFRSVRPYDFRHPNKLSKDQIRTLQMIFESFSRLVSSNLSGSLRSQVHLALVSIEQSVFDDYVHTLPQKTLLHLASLEPLAGTIVLEYDLGTAFLIVDRMLGGIGRVPQQERTITDIEEVLIQSAASIILDALSESWSHILAIKARLLRLEFSPRFVQVAPQSEPVVLLLFDLRIQDRQSTLSMCIPYSVIEPIAAQLNMQTLFASVMPGGTVEAPGDAEVRLQRVAIPVVAQLGRTQLAAGTVNELREGDVLRLDGLTTDPLVVMVYKKPTFVARPGLVRHNMAVQVVGVLQDGDMAS